MKKPKYWYWKREPKLIYFYEGDRIALYRLSTKKVDKSNILWDQPGAAKVADYMTPYNLDILYKQYEEYNTPKKYIKDILKDIANRIML